MLTMKPRAMLTGSVVIDAKKRDAVFLGYVGSAHPRNVIFEKGDNRSIVKLLVPVPSFLGAFLHVVLSCTGSEMGRIYASRVIARMKDVHSIWDFAVGIFVRKPVGKLLSDHGTQREHAVPFVIGIAGPYPASVRLHNLGPKSLSEHIASSFNVKLIDKYVFTHEKSRAGV